MERLKSRWENIERTFWIFISRTFERWLADILENTSESRDRILRNICRKCLVNSLQSVRTPENVLEWRERVSLEHRKIIRQVTENCSRIRAGLRRNCAIAETRCVRLESPSWSCLSCRRSLERWWTSEPARPETLRRWEERPRGPRRRRQRGVPAPWGWTACPPPRTPPFARPHASA